MVAIGTRTENRAGRDPRIRRSLSVLAGAALLCASGGLGGAATYDLAKALYIVEDPVELEQTWDDGWLYIPGSVFGTDALPILGPVDSAQVARRLERLQGRRIPVLVFLHGCAGFQYPETRVEKILRPVGVAVIFPNSFARSLRPRDCDLRRQAWGRFPLVYLYRRAEMLYAMERVRELSWVDRDNVFLGGFDEGAVSTALWGGEVNARGYLIAGWTCTAPDGLEWMHGLRIPDDRPVLAIVSRDDPWYRWTEFHGDCRSAAETPQNVVSLIIDGSVHDVFIYPETEQIMREFFAALLGTSMQVQ